MDAGFTIDCCEFADSGSPRPRLFKVVILAAVLIGYNAISQVRLLTDGVTRQATVVRIKPPKPPDKRGKYDRSRPLPIVAFDVDGKTIEDGLFLNDPHIGDELTLTHVPGIVVAAGEEPVWALWTLAGLLPAAGCIAAWGVFDFTRPIAKDPDLRRYGVRGSPSS